MMSRLREGRPSNGLGSAIRRTPRCSYAGTRLLERCPRSAERMRWGQSSHPIWIRRWCRVAPTSAWVVASKKWPSRGLSGSPTSHIPTSRCTTVSSRSPRDWLLRHLCGAPYRIENPSLRPYTLKLDTRGVPIAQPWIDRPADVVDGCVKQRGMNFTGIPLFFVPINLRGGRMVSSVPKPAILPSDRPHPRHRPVTIACTVRLSPSRRRLSLPWPGALPLSSDPSVEAIAADSSRRCGPPE